ncbi:MAG TPA: porin family protein [Chitinophagaceae bacterium]|nr:porin family protein [Chitinophagaceae bacterium]
MKKISLLALVLSSGVALFAQDQPMGSTSSTPQLRTKMSTAPRFGVKGGVNLASLELDDDATTTKYETNSKTSFHVGVFANLPLGGMLRLQPEILYQGGGAKIAGTPLVGSQTSTDNYELDLDYLAIPVMFQLQTNSGFFVEAGPQFAFMTTGRQDNQTGTDPDIKDLSLVRKTDFAIAAGIGYLSRIGLGAHATYVHGLSNVFNADNAPAAQKSVEMSNRGIKLGLHYQFGASK